MSMNLVRRPKLMEELGLTIGTLGGMERRREISRFKIGKCVYFDRKQVLARLGECRQPAPASLNPQPETAGKKIGCRAPAALKGGV